MAVNDEDTQPSVKVDPRAEPEQPKTKQLPAVPEWAIELTRSVKSGIAEVRADISLVSNDLGIVKDRVAIIETWKNDQDARATRTSAGVRNLSNTDAEQAAQLAQERAAREALASKVDALTASHAKLDEKTDVQTAILVRLDNVARNPLVKTLAAMLATAAIAWLAAHGVHIQ